MKPENFSLLIPRELPHVVLIGKSGGNVISTAVAVFNGVCLVKLGLGITEIDLTTNDYSNWSGAFT